MIRGIHKFFLIGAISIVGILAAKTAYASDFTGYTCDVGHMTSSQRAASDIFLNLKKIRIFVNVVPHDQLKAPDFPELLTPAALGEAIRKNAIKSFKKCLKNPDKAEDLIQVVTDPKDPVFEEGNTLGIYVRFQISRASLGSEDVAVFADSQKIVLFKIDYYRPSEDKFLYKENAPVGTFFIKYDSKKLESQIQRMIRAIDLY